MNQHTVAHKKAVSARGPNFSLASDRKLGNIGASLRR